MGLGRQHGVAGIAAILAFGLALGCGGSGSSTGSENLFAGRGGFLLNSGGSNGGGPQNPGPGAGGPISFNPGNGPTPNPTLTPTPTPTLTPTPTPTLTPTPTPTPPPPPPAGRLFISRRAGNTVGVYNATDYSLLDEVVVGNAPLGLAFDTVRNRVIVTLNDGTVVTFAADDFSDITSYPTVGTLAADVAYDPINDAIFVPHRFGGQLAANNAGTFASLAGFPVALTELVEVRVDAAGQRAFSIQNNGSSLFVVDIAGATSQTIVVPGGGFLDGLAYDDSPQRLFVGGFGNGTVIVYDASLPLPTQIQTIGTGTNPTSVAVDNVNDRVYTANVTSFDVAVFDYDQTAVVNPLTFDQGLATDPNGFQGPIGVYFDAQRNRILTTNESADTISVFDATTLAPVGGRDFPAGDGPYVILVEP